MKNKKREIAKFYEQILSDPKLKERLEEKAKKIANEEDFKNLIQQEIVPLMKKYNVNFSGKELLEYEEETLKKLSKEDFANVSGGVSIKSALLTGGILSMALLGGVGLNSSIADASGGQPKSKQQGQGQQQKSRRTVRKPKVKITEVTMSSDDDDDSRPSQKGEVKKTADKTKKVEEKSKQNDNDDKIQKEENEKPKPAIRKKQKKVEEESKQTDNDDDDIIQKESKKSKKVEESNQNNNNDNDDIIQERKKVKKRKSPQNNNGKRVEAKVLIEDLKKQKELYKTGIKLKLLPPTLDDKGYVKYMDVSKLEEFVSNLKIDSNYTFYNFRGGYGLIEDEDMLNIIKLYKKCCRNLYVPKKLFKNKGRDISELFKAAIFGNPYTINAAFEEGKVDYNYDGIIELFDKFPPIEEAKEPKFLRDAIDNFKKEGSKLNDEKIGQLKYENKLENGEETIDKAALRLGEFYKEFLRLTRNDYEQYLEDKKYQDEIKMLQQEFIGSDDMYKYYNKYLESMIKYEKERDTKRTENVTTGGYDSALARKFRLLDEKTRDALIKCTEKIAKKIKQSGEIYYIDDTFTNHTIDTNCLKIINGFNQIMPCLGGAVISHLTYTPCKKGIMGESLDTVASRLVEFLGNYVSRFQSGSYQTGSTTVYHEESVFDAVNKDNCFNKVLESLQPTGKNLDARFLYNDEKEAFKKAKEDIDYLHQYMKPNSDGTWTLKGSMFSSGRKIDGLGMIDYFYNNPELFE